jgi:hypothetical protein
MRVGDNGGGWMSGIVRLVMGAGGADSEAAAASLRKAQRQEERDEREAERVAAHEVLALKCSGVLALPEVVRLHSAHKRFVDIGNAARHVRAMDLTIVLSMANGGTLEDARAAGMPLADMARVLHDVFVGVQGLHAAGILHRDLKPDNVRAQRGARARGGEGQLPATHTPPQLRCCCSTLTLNTAPIPHPPPAARTHAHSPRRSSC